MQMALVSARRRSANQHLTSERGILTLVSYHSRARRNWPLALAIQGKVTPVRHICTSQMSDSRGFGSSLPRLSLPGHWMSLQTTPYSLL